MFIALHVLQRKKDRMLIFKNTTQFILCVVLFLTLHLSCNTPSENSSEKPEHKLNILLFSKTASFRHECIEPGSAAIKEYFEKKNLIVIPTEDASFFSDKKLSEFEAVIFFQTTG